jgi:Na+(H+)/acetate symporter ActP
VAEDSRREGLPTWATVTISVAGIVATLLAAIAASLITGHQQGKQQEKNVAAQATLQDKNLSAHTAAADRKELRS